MWGAGNFKILNMIILRKTFSSSSDLAGLSWRGRIEMRAARNRLKRIIMRDKKEIDKLTKKMPSARKVLIEKEQKRVEEMKDIMRKNVIADPRNVRRKYRRLIYALN